MDPDRIARSLSRHPGWSDRRLSRSLLVRVGQIAHVRLKMLEGRLQAPPENEYARIRAVAGLSQVQLGKLAGVSFVTVIKFEKGRGPIREKNRISLLAAYAKIRDGGFEISSGAPDRGHNTHGGEIRLMSSEEARLARDFFGVPIPGKTVVLPGEGPRARAFREILKAHRADVESRRRHRQFGD